MHSVSCVGSYRYSPLPTGRTGHRQGANCTLVPRRSGCHAPTDRDPPVAEESELVWRTGMSSATQQRPDRVGAMEASAAAATVGDTADEQVAASAGTRELGAAHEQCAWLFAHFDADKDGLLNRLEYKEFLKSIDVWGRSDAYLV